MAEADLQGADATQRRAADTPAASLGDAAIPTVHRRYHGLDDELAVLGAAAFRRAVPRHGDQVAAAQAVVGGNADHDERRQAAVRHCAVELRIQTPAAVPAFPHGDLGRERRIELGGKRVPVEQVVTVVEVEDRVAAVSPRSRSPAAGRPAPASAVPARARAARTSRNGGMRRDRQPSAPRRRPCKPGPCRCRLRSLEP